MPAMIEDSRKSILDYRGSTTLLDIAHLKKDGVKTMILKILFLIAMAIGIWQETIVLVLAFRGNEIPAINLILASLCLAFSITYLIGLWT